MFLCVAGPFLFQLLVPNLIPREPRKPLTPFILAKKAIQKISIEIYLIWSDILVKRLYRIGICRTNKNLNILVCFFLEASKSKRTNNQLESHLV